MLLCQRWKVLECLNFAFILHVFNRVVIPSLLPPLSLSWVLLRSLQTSFFHCRSNYKPFLKFIFCRKLNLKLLTRDKRVPSVLLTSKMSTSHFIFYITLQISAACPFLVFVPVLSWPFTPSSSFLVSYNVCSPSRPQWTRSQGQDEICWFRQSFSLGKRFRRFDSFYTNKLFVISPDEFLY